MPDLMADHSTADAAFAALLQQQRDRVLGLLRRLCPREAEDLLQETLARAWRYRDTCDLGSNPPGWLLQVAFRTFLDHRARKRREVVADDAAVRLACRTPHDATALRDELQRSLHRLSTLQRALLIGFHQEELSLHDLARRHGLPLGTVKSHLHRARRRLVRPDLEDHP